ncbi:MAG: asparaginase [Chloroflexota bacterium]|nr:asparaginase [Chloroflexota bacterium]
MAVAVVFTGGTIASRVDSAAGGALPVLRGHEIVAQTPGLADVATVEPIDWGLVPASHLGFTEILGLARLIDGLLARPDVDGAVVVQGTDTIEETSFAFDLLVPSAKPVVVTGAMRTASDPDYDGPRNLTDAVACAAAHELREQGTLVVLNGLVIGADVAVKTHATAMDTFQPRDGEPLARVRDASVEASQRRQRVVLPAIPDAAAEPVHLLTASTGMDGTLVRLARATHPRGLVVAAAGTGNTHPDLLAAAVELIGEGTVLALTTRCAGGRVAPAYAFPGGGATWARAGALLSALNGPKCRIALGLGLGAGLSGRALADALRA